MTIKRHQVIIAALIVLGLTFLVIGVLYQPEPVKYYAHSLRTWQEADSVAGYPIRMDVPDGDGPGKFTTAAFQPNLSTLSPMERFRLPTARGFVEFPDKRARAAAIGLVLYTGDPEGYPGRAVLLGHRLPDRSIVQTLYTGLTSIRVRVGQILPQGTPLGTGGSLAEVRAGASIDLASETIAGHTLNHHNHPAPANRLDLVPFLAKYANDVRSPDPLSLIRENQLRAAREKQNLKAE